MAEKKDSEATSTPQERGQGEIPAAAGASRGSASERVTGAQDQGTGNAGELSTEQLLGLLAARPELAEALADAEPFKRRVQSEADKRLERYRREQEARQAEREAQRQAEERQRALDELDDEDYGRTVREQQKLSAQTTAQTAEVVSATYRQLGESLLAAIPDQQSREKVETATYQRWDDFVAACLEAAAEGRAAKKVVERERQIREAALKNATAETADQFAPNLGTGLPVSNTPVLHGRAAIAAGFAERAAQKKR